MSTYPDASDCQRCDQERRQALIAAAGGNDWDYPSGMITCPTCGNKRCPRATYHGNDCTGSNAPNQPGSSYQTCACTWSTVDPLDPDFWTAERYPNPACTVEGHNP